MFGKKEKQADLDVFVIYDSKVSAYGQPNFAVNEQDLIRQLINMFKDPSQAQNRLLLNAEDYSVFKIGTYDKKNGELEIHNPVHVANMHDLRALVRQDGIVTT